jgi:hypothetical protein
MPATSSQLNPLLDLWVLVLLPEMWSLSLVAYLHKTRKTVTSTNAVGAGISRVSHITCSFETLGSNSGWTETHSFFFHPSRRFLRQSVGVNAKGSDYGNIHVGLQGFCIVHNILETGIVDCFEMLSVSGLTASIVRLIRE